MRRQLLGVYTALKMFLCFAHGALAFSIAQPKLDRVAAEQA
jgi:hypothetical protein